jgi:CRP-like cAMP-binding protein
LTNDNFFTEFKEVATKGTGEFFGELALIDNKPRSATIKCITPCFFATLDKTSYDNSLGKIQTAQLESMIDFLSSIPQFGGTGGSSTINEITQKDENKWTWSKTALSRLSYYFKEVKYRRSNVVYKKGDPVQYVYIVLDGEFELEK